MSYPPDDERLARALKALGHPARLLILRRLAAAAGCFCGDIVRSLDLAQSTVSQHIDMLKAAGLVSAGAAGTRPCYCLDREAVSRLRSDLAALLDALDGAATSLGHASGAHLPGAELHASAPRGSLAP